MTQRLINSSRRSIINLTSPSTANHPSLPFSRPSTLTPPAVYPALIPTTKSSNATSAPPGTSARARALRRAARSALVDTYRLFVLSELITRLQGPSDSPDQQLVRSQEYRRKDKVTFGVWILHSMRRRALERMEQLLEEAEAEVKARGYIANVNQDLNVAFFGMEPTTTAVPLSFSDDEDEMEQPPPGLSFSTKSDKEDSDSDETDGSSVHTPSTTSHFQCYPMRPVMSRTSSSSSHSADDSSSTSSDDNKVQQDPENKEDKPTLAAAQNGLPRISQFQSMILVPSIPTPAPHVIQYLSSASLHEYTHLVELRSRLGHLLLFSASQARVAADETQSRLEILAVRSRRRAWSNRALSLMARSQAGLGGAAIYGLVTPFRNSSLARHMWTAEDLFREPSSSASPFLSNTLTRCSSRGFPSYRPRLRPKIQYDIETLAVEVNDNPFGDDEDFEGVTNDHVPVDFDYEMYEDVNDPSALAGHARRHIRGGTRKFSSARPVPGRSGIGRLFPVSEEIDGEVQDHFPDEDEVLEFAVHGRHHGNEKRTFMGCDEVKVESKEEEEDCLEDLNELDVELGFGEFCNPEVSQNMGANGERMSSKMDRPTISPRARTTSMMGTFVHRTKKAQSAAFHAASHQSGSELTKDSLLCQPVPASVSTPTNCQGSPPKLQIQSQVRVKVGSPPKDIRKAIQISASPSPAIYNGVEVDMELDVQIRVGDYLPDAAGCDQHYVQDTAPPLSIMLPKQHIMNPVAPEDEEFTLSMDVPAGGRRNRSVPRHNYPTRPLSRHEFEENRRPKLGSIFSEPRSAFMPKLSDVTP